jgi:chromosome segregation ATPase
VEDLQTRIDDEATRMSDGNRAKRQALEAQQQQAIADRKALERKQVELGEELYKIERDLAGVTARERETAAGRDRLRTRVAEAQTLQDRLRSARGNRLAAYGPNIPQLMQSIEREKGWRQKPVGPIGVHLKLKDMEWAPVLESVIGNTLNAFCVTNHHDRRLLENHKRRTNNPFVSILTGSDEPFDFSHGEPPEDIATILRVLDIDNDFVMRQLVNAVHIERAALVPRRVDGDTLMRARRPNVQFAFSKDMYRISGG